MKTFPHCVVTTWAKKKAGEPPEWLIAGEPMEIAGKIKG
jgi:hypothetical protein